LHFFSDITHSQNLSRTCRDFSLVY